MAEILQIGVKHYPINQSINLNREFATEQFYTTVLTVTATLMTYRNGL